MQKRYYKGIVQKDYLPLSTSSSAIRKVLDVRIRVGIVPRERRQNTHGMTGSENLLFQFANCQGHAARLVFHIIAKASEAIEPWCVSEANESHKTS